tara:strand:- start:114 stop:419 length:306 start_codon:yes stop_codon:yes gene_type:complete
LISDPGWAGIDALPVSNHSKIFLGSRFAVDYQERLLNLDPVTRDCGKAFDVMRASTLLSLAALMNSCDATGIKNKDLAPAWSAKIVRDLVYENQISGGREP